MSLFYIAEYSMFFNQPDKNRLASLCINLLGHASIFQLLFKESPSGI